MALTRWRWAALAAVATILALLSFGLVPASDACLAAAASPWAAFQQVSTPEAAEALLRACGGDSLRQGMRIDALAFVPSFTAFLLATLWALRPSHLIGLAAIALLSVGVLADQIEGFRLLALIDADGGSATMVAAANRATFAKELFLALATGVIGLAMFVVRGWHRYTGALVVAAAAIAVASTLTHQPNSTALGVAWLVLAIVALVSAVPREAETAPRS